METLMINSYINCKIKKLYCKTHIPKTVHYKEQHSNWQRQKMRIKQCGIFLHCLVTCIQCLLACGTNKICLMFQFLLQEWLLCLNNSALKLSISTEYYILSFICNSQQELNVWFEESLGTTMNMKYNVLSRTDSGKQCIQCCIKVH
jgi:hypothetical protein